MDDPVDLDPASQSMVEGLGAQIAAYGTGFASRKWSVPVYNVPADQPAVRVTIDSGNADLQRAFEAVPVPRGARPAEGTDAHLVIYQPSTDRMWEMFRAARLTDGWHARYGGRILGVSTHPGHYRDLRSSTGEVLERPWWGATATSLPLVGGLITLRDLRRGYINHAIAMAVPQVLQGWKAWPAQRSDGKFTDASAIPEGARFRLDPTLDVTALGGPPIVRMAARAAQRYGIILRDGGGAVAFYGEDPKGSSTVMTQWDAAFGGLAPYQILQAFPFDRLQLLRMDLSTYTP